MTLERVFKISQRNLAPTRTQFSFDKINLNLSDSDISLKLPLKPAISLKNVDVDHYILNNLKSRM